MHHKSILLYKSFILMLLVFYFPGLVLYPFFVDSYQSYYNFQGAPYTAFFIFYFIYCALFFIVFSLANKAPYLHFIKLSTDLSFYICCIIVISYFVCSIYFFINYDASFRHTDRLANSGALVKGMFILQPIVYFFLMFCIVHTINGNQIGSKNKFLLFLVFVSLVASLNSSLQVFSILFVLILLLKPSVYSFNIRKIKVHYFVLTILAVPLILSGIIIMGIGNKVGFEYLLSDEGLTYFIGIIGFIVARVSSSLFSLATLFECCLADQSLSINALNGFINTFLNRLSLIFPFSNFESGLIDTVNRTNFLLVFNGFIGRAGASPGSLASMFYAPIFPLGIIFIPIIHVMIARAVSFHMNSFVKYNIFSLMAISYFLLPFFEAPLNIFYIIDPMFFSFIVLILFRCLALRGALNK